MQCLYCNKRLGLFSFKKRPFCSELHEVAYHDERSGLAMRRVMDPLFMALQEPPSIPVIPDRNLSPLDRDSTIPPVQRVAVSWLCNFVVELDRPKPVPPDLAAAAVLLEAEPFTGPAQRPSCSMGVTAFTLDSATQPAGEIAAEGDPAIAACRVQPKGSRRFLRRSSAAFSSPTHRRRRR